MALQYSLPKRRAVVKSGILREPKRTWRRHEAFVRRHQCCVPSCELGPIEFAHVRSAANAGTGLKPHSAHGISLCCYHHIEQHRIGQPAFERKYSIDMNALAAAFVKASPDTAMKAALVGSG